MRSWRRARALDLFIGWSIFQIAFDPQDGHNHAAFWTQALLGSKPSVLVIEGIEDPLVPNNATRSLAYTLDWVPQLDAIVPVSYLPKARGTVTGNVDTQTTAAHIQYVPAGLPDLEASVGCETQENGHFCAQIAADSIAERVLFFQSAVDDGVPRIGTP